MAVLDEPRLCRSSPARRKHEREALARGDDMEKARLDMTMSALGNSVSASSRRTHKQPLISGTPSISMLPNCPPMLPPILVNTSNVTPQQARLRGAQDCNRAARGATSTRLSPIASTFPHLNLSSVLLRRPEKEPRLFLFLLTESLVFL